MYLPKHFSPNDDEKVRKLIERNSFATILSFPAGEKPFINHLPVIFSTKPFEENIKKGVEGRKKSTLLLSSYMLKKNNLLKRSNHYLKK